MVVSHEVKEEVGHNKCMCKKIENTMAVELKCWCFITQDDNVFSK